MDAPRLSLNQPRTTGDVPSLTAAQLNKPLIPGRFAPDALPPPALPAKRQRELLRLIHEHGQMRVTELAGRLNVSGYTIRRDLDSMARCGLITRTYGGAVVADGFAFAGRTTDLTQRTNAQAPAKRRIARAACKLIKDAETLIAGGGSTTTHFGEELPPRGLTIVTNNVNLLTGLAHKQKAYRLGVQYHHDAQVLVGPVSLLGLGIMADTAVIGAGGITAEDGLTTNVLEEAHMLPAMIAVAHRTIVLADATKFGRRLFGCIGSLRRIKVLVPDEAPQRELAVALQKAQVRVVIAKED